MHRVARPVAAPRLPVDDLFMERSEVLALAARQHGAVAIRQLRRLGITNRQVVYLKQGPDWQQVTGQVVVRRGSADTPARRVSVAVLDAGDGAVLSHRSAAAWWGHRGSRLENPIQVSLVGAIRRRPQCSELHRVRSLPREWVTDANGVAVVRPELAALQIFATHRPERADRIVDSMWSQRLLSGASIAALLQDLGRRGRNGTAGLRLYLAARGIDYQPPDSGIESRALQILARAGIPMRSQVDLGGEHSWSGRVDLLHPDLPLVVEIQSSLHHSSLTDRADDRRRIDRLRCDGFVVVELTDEMVWTDPGRVVREVRAALASLRSSVLRN